VSCQREHAATMYWEEFARIGLAAACQLLLKICIGSLGFFKHLHKIEERL
jgi:hypothetical protein